MKSILSRAAVCLLSVVIAISAAIFFAPASNIIADTDFESTYVDGDFEYKFFRRGYNNPGAMILRYKGNDEVVQIPSTMGGKLLRVIDADAFKGNTSIKKLVINGTFERIGGNAFEGCTSLEEVKIEKSYDLAIESEAFKDCTKLSTFTFADTSSVATDAFEGCTSLYEFNSTHEGSAIYDNCLYSEGFEELLAIPPMNDDELGLPKKLKKSDFASIIKNTNVKYIGFAEGSDNFVFEGDVIYTADMTKLCYWPASNEADSFTFPSTVKEVSRYAFADASKLKTVTIPSDSAFTSITGNSTDATPSFLGYIPNLEWLRINKVIDETGYMMFGNKTLKKLSVTQGQKLGEYAFAYCDKLNSINSPEKISYLGNCCLAGCTSLQFYVVEGKTELYNDNVFRGGGYAVHLKPKEGKYEYYILDRVYVCNMTNVTVPLCYGDNFYVREIGDSAFAEKTRIETVLIDPNVRIINSRAFKGCTNATISYFNTSETSADSFERCKAVIKYNTDLTGEVEIGEAHGAITSIPEHFSHYSVVSIASGAFEDVTFDSITIPKTITTIGDNAIPNANKIIHHRLEDADISDTAFGTNIDVETVWYYKLTVRYQTETTETSDFVLIRNGAALAFNLKNGQEYSTYLQAGTAKLKQSEYPLGYGEPDEIELEVRDDGNIYSDNILFPQKTIVVNEVLKKVLPDPTATSVPTTVATPTATPEPTAAATATATPRPTSTTAPTATAVPTTAPVTKVPSATPAATKAVTTAPTASATPAPTAEATTAPEENKDPKTQIREFVDRIYIYVLDREPEEEGAAFWCDELYGFRRTGAEVAQGFIFSAEFENRNTSDKDFVTILYKTFFGREPEEDGMNFWLSQLSSKTMDRIAVANGFIYSQEWADTCASYGIRSGGDIKPAGKIEPTALTYAFVERMYTTAMERGYDEEGRQYWAGLLANFDTTGEQVGASFFLSAEMENYKLTDAEFLNRLYKTFMDRESDSDGAAYWLGVMASGSSRADVVFGFTRSAEFTDKCIEARILPY